MENKINESGIKAAAVTEAPAPLEPEELVEQLRAFRQRIPEYGPLPTPQRRALKAVARADAAFVQSAINTIGSSDAVSQAVGVSAEELRRQSEVAMRWSAVEDELRTLLQGVTAANLTRRHGIALSALQAYHIGRQLVRKQENADLLPQVAEMKRLNRFGRRRKTAAAPEPPPVTPTPGL